MTGDGSDVEGDAAPTGRDRDGNDTASAQFYEYVARRAGKRSIGVVPLTRILGVRRAAGACSFVLRIMGDQKVIDFTDVAPPEVGRYVAAAAFQNVLCMRCAVRSVHVAQGAPH